MADPAMGQGLTGAGARRQEEGLVAAQVSDVGLQQVGQGRDLSDSIEVRVPNDRQCRDEGKSSLAREGVERTEGQG